MEEKKKRGRPVGAKNIAPSRQGAKIVAYLRKPCYEEFERLRGGRVVGEFICELLKRHPDYRAPEAQEDSS